MNLRSTAVTAAVSAAAALAATGITYASAASAPAPQHAPAVAAAAPSGGNGGQNNNSKGNEGNNGKGNEGHEDNDDHGRRGEDEGRIQINERSYSTHPGDCITVVSGLGAKSLNIRNDSRKTVEVFRGAVCDNGAPIATVGPHSSSDGVRPGCVDGIDIDKGVVASFRVIKRHHDED
ncbi:hypothetical protein ACFW1F_18020 [Streptomyces bungoensis]|uniref:hypothetical protein n=1 Tax=Streptomyces bungoensis TaxID=285568 RepID=UPI0036789EF9